MILVVVVLVVVIVCVATLAYLRHFHSCLWRLSPIWIVNIFRIILVATRALPRRVTFLYARFAATFANVFARLLTSYGRKLVSAQKQHEKNNWCTQLK